MHNTKIVPMDPFADGAVFGGEEDCWGGEEEACRDFYFEDLLSEAGSSRALKEIDELCDTRVSGNTHGLAELDVRGCALHPDFFRDLDAILAKEGRRLGRLFATLGSDECGGMFLDTDSYIMVVAVHGARAFVLHSLSDWEARETDLGELAQFGCDDLGAPHKYGNRGAEFLDSVAAEKKRSGEKARRKLEKERKTIRNATVGITGATGLLFTPKGIYRRDQHDPPDSRGRLVVSPDPSASSKEEWRTAIDTNRETLESVCFDGVNFVHTKAAMLSCAQCLKLSDIQVIGCSNIASQSGAKAFSNMLSSARGVRELRMADMRELTDKMAASFATAFIQGAGSYKTLGEERKVRIDFSGCVRVGDNTVNAIGAAIEFFHDAEKAKKAKSKKKKTPTPIVVEALNMANTAFTCNDDYTAATIVMFMGDGMRKLNVDAITFVPARLLSAMKYGQGLIGALDVPTFVFPKRLRTEVRQLGLTRVTFSTAAPHPPKEKRRTIEDVMRPGQITVSQRDFDRV